ncbi:hypothetical protein V0288_13390 [Pannus brasiliensis CCIBt3594]|uniref:Uncharacterized protein n=1 Tax=Pannus brasiliensis CCIBt3594 TaxID=1427578 RepID=A0AAW9QTB8_9CHRO
MNHFKLKSLIFYGTTIGFVLLIFKAVTVYGETRLSAAPPIAGTYRLLPSKNSPCLGNNPRLAIEQSGIYLLGTLSIEGQQVPLDGRFRGENFRLQGRSSPGKSCGDEIVMEAIARDKKISGTLQDIPVTFEKESIPTADSSTGH